MTTTPVAEPGGEMNVNSVVSYNLRAIRQHRGMTQEQVAAALAQFTGHRLTQAAISAMERRRRRFDAHDLYLLSAVFGVPIVYFFLPPAGEPRHLADTGRPAHDLYTATLGAERQLDDVIDRLAAPEPDQAASGATADPDGPLTPGTCLESFLAWRQQPMAELASDPLDAAAQRLIDDLIALRRALLCRFCHEHRTGTTND